MSEKASNLGIPEELHDFMPGYEPRVGGNHWRIPVADPWVPEEGIEAVIDALRTRKISSAAPPAKKLAEEVSKYYNVPYTQPCCNGYSAVILALRAANIGPGDHVLCPALTMIAVGNAVIATGAKPLFCDNEVGLYNPSVEDYLKQATPETKCLIVAHTYGIPANMKAIAALCLEKGWILIEDICEAIGTRIDGQLVGTFGDFGCASMYVNKMITSGDGGFTICKDAKYAPRLLSLVNHGFREDFHFVHLEVSGNYKICGIGAAMAAASVKDIDLLASKRRHVASIYRKALAGLKGLRLMPATVPYGEYTDAPWVFGIEVDERKHRTPVRQKLADSGIETRDFFLPMNRQPSMYTHGGKGSCLPECERQGLCGFYLPTHSHLTEELVAEIAAAVVAAVGEVIPQ